MYTKKTISSLSFTLISFFVGAQESVATETVRDKSQEITITFINTTNNRIRAIFHDVTAIMQAALYNEHSDDNEPLIQIMDYCYCLRADSNPQAIVLSKQQLSTRDADEGVLDLTTANSCTLSLYDSNTRLKRECTFSLKNDVTIAITYTAGCLEIEQIPS